MNKESKSWVEGGNKQGKRNKDTQKENKIIILKTKTTASVTSPV